MIVLRKNYTDLKQISSEKGLQIFIGTETTGDVQLLAYDNTVLYESYLLKSTDEYNDFVDNDLASIANKKTYTPNWDTINITFPDALSELHTYLNNGVVVQTVKTTFENISKRQILKVEKTVV